MHADIQAVYCDRRWQAGLRSEVTSLFDVQRSMFDLPAMPLVSAECPGIVCDAWQAGVGRSSFNMFPSFVLFVVKNIAD